MTVRARWVRQDTINRHLDAGTKANNENLLRLAAKIRELEERIESLERRRWWKP